MQLEIQDTFITTLFETKFYKDKHRFIEAIKESFKLKSKLEAQEYNLLKSYERDVLMEKLLGEVKAFVTE